MIMYQEQREMWTVPLGPDPKANGLPKRQLLDSCWDPIWMFVSRDGGINPDLEQPGHREQQSLDNAG